MKKLFIGFSRYNEKTNGIIFDSIRNMTFDQFSRDCSSYYRTICDTVFHVMHSDLRWLSRMTPFYATQLSVDTLQPFMIDSGPDDRLIFDKIDSFTKLRIQIDGEIKKLIMAIPEKTFTTDFSMQFGSKPITRTLWKLLLQWFNHHTHHRGQISVQFDMIGVDNDFSLVLDKIE
ncbi:MAG: hypothetical protein JW904_11775 [Spirochaetales bacterium]|nr:hypothetical protein [Spirochaetales bacterium]